MDSTRKKRGATKMTHVHARTSEERKVVVLNNKTQPHGPKDETLNEFSRFLGTLARDGTLAPLNYVSWHKVPNKEKLWEYVNQKYMVPPDGKKWVLKCIGDYWRTHKCRLKKRHYKAYTTDEDRWKNRPTDMSEEQFRDLLNFWNSESSQRLTIINTVNRAMQTRTPSMDLKSCSRISYNLQNNEDKELSSESEMQAIACNQNPEQVYRVPMDDTNAYTVANNKTHNNQEDRDSSSESEMHVITRKRKPEHISKVPVNDTNKRTVTNNKTVQIEELQSHSVEISRALDALITRIIEPLQSRNAELSGRDTTTNLKEKPIAKKVIPRKKRTVTKKKTDLIEDVQSQHSSDSSQGALVTRIIEPVQATHVELSRRDITPSNLKSKTTTVKTIPRNNRTVTRNETDNADSCQGFGTFITRITEPVQTTHVELGGGDDAPANMKDNTIAKRTVTRSKRTVARKETAQIEEVQSHTIEIDRGLDALVTRITEPVQARRVELSRRDTATNLKEKTIAKNSSIIPPEKIESIKAQLLEELQQDMRQCMEEQMARMKREIFSMIMSGLQNVTFGMNMTPEIIAAMFPPVPSQDDRCSAPHAPAQFRNVPSFARVQVPDDQEDESEDS